MSELLAQYELDPDRRREMKLAIHGEVKRLARMIGEYLDITRLESGATTLRRSAVRVEPLVERILLLLEPLAAQRKIRLVRTFDPAVPATEVTVSTTPEGSGSRLDVSDQGYGIPASDLDRVFDKFCRVPRLEDAEVPGTGLGLSLVREIAGLHGGSISVASVAGSGSTFSLRIPQAEKEPQNESHGELG